MTILFKGGVRVPQGGINIISPDIAPTWVTPSGSLGSNHEALTITSQNYQVQATDPDGPSPLVYAVVSGSLPTGSTLDPSTGAITGPAVSVTSTTTYNFTVRVSDSRITADRAFSITVNNNTQPVWQTASGSLGVVFENNIFNTTVVATDVDGLPMALTYSIVAGSLPAGITLDSATGAISGTASNVNSDTTFIFTVRASDGLDFADRQFNITVLNGIDNAVLLNRVDTPNLVRTPSIVGNRKTWTMSFWTKRANLGTPQSLVEGFGSPVTSFFFNTSNKLGFAWSGADSLVTTATFTDTSAWYHIVMVADTTQATSSNRLKLYVNGNQITAFDTAIYPGQNSVGNINNTTAFNIASRDSSFSVLSPVDGYISDFYFVDGQTLTPTSFGVTNNSIWRPQKYTGTYGTNGFHLEFKNNTTYGLDTSGNNNNFTQSGLTTTDQVLDTPTFNFPILNFNDRDTAITLQEGGLLALLPNQISAVRATNSIPTTGKWYWETKVIVDGNRWATGMATSSFAVNTDVLGTATNSLAFSGNPLIQYQGSNAGGTPVNPVAGDVIRIAYDADTRKVWFGVNGTWHNGGNPAAGTGEQFTINPGTYYSIVGNRSTTVGQQLEINFGQKTFAFTPPTGFNSIIDKNPLPAV